MRASRYLAGPARALWQLLYADDGLLASSGARRFKELWLAILVLAVLGLPLQWAKLAGGVRLEWVGYE
eukprot:3961037-Lingulodinium_polyedra.AAC.1